MATTLTGTLLGNDVAYWVQVGGSRIYVLSDRQLTQLIQDQNLSQFLFDQGEITAERARKHPGRHHLYQCVGCGSCKPDTVKMRLRHGDLLVQTTDGLKEEIPPKTITSILNSSGNIESKVKLPAPRGEASRKGRYLFQIASLSPALKGGACREASRSKR
ncbi:MAG: hypothetical protein PVI06_10210 [Desulfobacterales bacterium]|jgi:protein phosphatase